MLLIDESGKMWIRDILPSDLFTGAQDVLAMFGCFAHAQDARVLGAGKLILFKVFIRKARRFWAMICLIFKSASATLPGQQHPSLASSVPPLPPSQRNGQVSTCFSPRSPGGAGTFSQRASSPPYSCAPSWSWKLKQIHPRIPQHGHRSVAIQRVRAALWALIFCFTPRLS